jgi:hypothetical protein
MMSVAERDVVSNPTLAGLLEPMLEYWRAAKETLVEGLVESDASRRLVEATLALALALPTWRLLTSDEGLSDEECVEVFVRMVQAQSDRFEDTVDRLLGQR